MREPQIASIWNVPSSPDQGLGFEVGVVVEFEEPVVELEPELDPKLDPELKVELPPKVELEPLGPFPC